MRKMLRIVPWAAALFVVAGCGGSGKTADVPPVAEEPAPRPEEPADIDHGPLAGEAVAGVEDERLKALLRDHWDWRMRRSPVWATTLGDHRFDDELSPSSHQAVQEERARTRLFLSEARNLPREELGRSDRITLDLFIQELEADVASEVCDFHLWSVSTFGNPLSRFNSLPERHGFEDREDAENLLARYRKIAHSIGSSIDNLRRGLEAGLVVSRESARRTIEMVDGQLEKPVAEWALVEPAEELDEDLAEELERVVEESVKPAVERYRGVLAEEVLPAARGPKEVGVGALPDGAACYRARIESYTGLELTAEELHELGLQEIERINGEMRKLGKKVFGTANFRRIVRRLRNDEKLYFEEREQVLRAAKDALAAAREEMPAWFGILPEAKCVVVEIPDYEAPYTTIAYYRQPHPDGSKPGEYFINTHKPEVRPRFEMQVLAYHEAIPGHHLQIAISQERGELPAFRRYGGNTAYVEGWALYTERLAEEMGLYQGDLDRMGMLSYDAWRAARLVVDTGIHSMGWTRERAEKYMRAHTALAKENIENEVDRYIAWPGQALAYKVGQLEILELRRQAKEELGEAFDIKAFHDAVLKNGAVTLPVLREEIERWIAAQKEEG